MIKRKKYVSWYVFLVLVLLGVSLGIIANDYKGAFSEEIRNSSSFIGVFPPFVMIILSPGLVSYFMLLMSIRLPDYDKSWLKVPFPVGQSHPLNFFNIFACIFLLLEISILCGLSCLILSVFGGVYLCLDALGGFLSAGSLYVGIRCFIKKHRKELPAGLDFKWFA